MPALMPLPGFLGPTNQAMSLTVDAELTINLFPETKDAGNPKSDVWFYRTPGLASLITISGGEHRGSFQLNGRAWAVVGTNVGEVTYPGGVWTFTSRGTVTDDGLQATMASNGPGGNQLLVASAGLLYCLNLLTNAFAIVADPDVPTQIGMVTFLDGYFLVNQTGTAKFYLSALEDGTDWDPLDVAQKSQTNDFIVAIVVDLDRKTVWLLGNLNTEIWWDSGATFPFEPVPNAILSMGIAGPFAWGLPDSAIHWIGESANGGRHAYEAMGLQSDEITTHAVSQAWSEYATVSDCVVWTYEYRSHSFTVFNFPTADATWVYDRAEKAWHQFLYWDSAAGVYRQHLAITHMYAFNTHLVGSRIDGTLYRLSGDDLSDNGASIRWLRRFPHLNAAGCQVFCDEIRFGFQVGVGLVAGQGSDPQIMFRLSRDGGVTYGNERWTSLGALGDYLRRVRYLRNGCWRDGVLEISGTDPVIIALAECHARLRKGTQ